MVRQFEFIDKSLFRVKKGQMSTYLVSAEA